MKSTTASLLRQNVCKQSFNSLYRAIAFSVGSALVSPLVIAAGVTGDIEELLVTETGWQNDLQSKTEAASVGTVFAEQIAFRPTLRPAELLETIPGMVVTQHSGDGKANQYFLRGFNLDHGSDFANHVEDMPVNKVSHGHGQGYTDLNFLIPELVDRMIYKKGPYYASEGDFSSAGSARIEYADQLDQQQAKITLGENNYQRLLFTGGVALAEGNLIYALESLRNDGPWKTEENFDKKNAVLKYSQGDRANGWSAAVMGYDTDWHSTDQIPQRLVDSGELDRYGSLDPTTGGDTHRYSLSTSVWQELDEKSRFNASAYLLDYQLRLTSNATYFSADAADDPSNLGDQFTQFDDRMSYGGSFNYEWDVDAVHHLSTGANLRYDDIKDVGVGSSYHADIYQLISRSSVEEFSQSLYASVNSQWNDWLATIVGVRYDHYQVDVYSRLSGGVEGDASDDLVSPKFSLRFGPFAETEFFVNYGEGFHSNDARGVVNDAAGVPMLSPSKGYELGLRSAIVEHLQFSVVVFRLDLDSELVFVGDDATTEPRGATKRTGIEIGAYYQPVDWLVLDIDYATSETRFKDPQYDGADLLGDYVPDSIEDVFSLGLSVDLDSGAYGGLRLRYFGPRKLTESGDIESDSTTMVNANVGYRWHNGLTLGLEVLNLFDNEDDDITYLYESRTLSERQASIDPIESFHSHPVEPLTVRVTASYTF
ncbi:TonB-dependent receptor [Aestuariicella hydrocarbonica]|uniref:TonB-dependent receptor n=1 Tax=Pseudomaricurvus hydrocarbonicus TaxID=1470433 RepID=A0A9E5MQ90_9GAMM|nr:TonB-dependent receptor [Aestuariicella hydrocarbonica]